MTYISPPQKFLIILCCKHIELQVVFLVWVLFFIVCLFVLAISDNPYCHLLYRGIVF